jgi:excisionase family DNA binding protein
MNLLTTRQVADRLGVTVSTVSRWAKFGDITVAARLPGKRGQMLFDPVDVAKFEITWQTRVDRDDEVAS